MKRYLDVKVLGVQYSRTQTGHHKASGTFQFRDEQEVSSWRATFRTRWDVTIDRELSPQVFKQVTLSIESVLGYVNLPIKRTYHVNV